MFRLLKVHWKDIVVLLAMAIGGYFATMHIKSWYDFRQAQLINTAIIVEYFKADNPQLLNKIINGGNNAAKTQRPPAADTEASVPADPGQGQGAGKAGEGSEK